MKPFTYCFNGKHLIGRYFHEIPFKLLTQSHNYIKWLMHLFQSLPLLAGKPLVHCSELRPFLFFTALTLIWITFQIKLFFVCMKSKQELFSFHEYLTNTFTFCAKISKWIVLLQQYNTIHPSLNKLCFSCFRPSCRIRWSVSDSKRIFRKNFSF